MDTTAHGADDGAINACLDAINAFEFGHDDGRVAFLTDAANLLEVKRCVAESTNPVGGAETVVITVTRRLFVVGADRSRTLVGE